MAQPSRTGGGPLVPNPFIKKHNLEWTIEVPPPKRRRSSAPSPPGPQAEEPRPTPDETPTSDPAGPPPSPAAASIAAQTLRLRRLTAQPFPPSTPRLPIDAFAGQLAASLGSAAGAHFVIHQHDHPVAGVHYDLRLQINPTSSASFALPYGPPGAPASARPARAAVETRVHALHSHAAEGASRAGGVLLVWDAGAFEVLPPPTGPASPGAEDDDSPSALGETQQDRLRAALAARSVRLRLHGARLPRAYAVHLRVTRAEDAAARARAEKAAAGAKPRRRRVVRRAADRETSSSSGGSDDGPEADEGAPPADDGDAEERRTNAYAGATNSVGSVYQRRWFVSLDRPGCGLVRRQSGGRVVWEREDDGTADGGDGGRLGFPFYVRGPDVERSIVTGRLAADIIRDDGVEGLVRRRGWAPILN